MSDMTNNIKYKRRLNESYEVVEMSEGELIFHEMEMLRKNQLQGLLPLEFMIEDGVGQFWYQITGLQSIENMQKIGRFGKEELLTLLRGIQKTSVEIERYLLREGGLLLQEMYFSADGKRVFFPYIPVYEREEPLKEQLLTIIEKLVRKVDYTKKDYVTLLFCAYEELQMENGSLEKLLEEEEKGILMLDLPENPVEKMERDKEVVADFEYETQKLETELEDTRTVSESVLARGKEKVSKDIQDKVKDISWNIKKTIRKYKPEKTKRWESSRDKAFSGKGREKGDSIIRYLESEYIMPGMVSEELVEYPTEYLGDMQQKDGQLYDKEPTLIFQGESNEGKKMPLNKNRVVIGKKEGYADIVIEDSTVSRMHAMIEREEDGYVLEDLNSLNGTYINGNPVIMAQRVLLKDQDSITLGHTNLIFQAP